MKQSKGNCKSQVNFIELIHVARLYYKASIMIPLLTKTNTSQGQKIVYKYMDSDKWSPNLY